MSKETKEARFIRVAEQRTQKVLEALSALSKCAAQASYDYTPEQVEVIFSVINAELELTRSRFDGKRQFALTPQGDGTDEL